MSTEDDDRDDEMLDRLLTGAEPADRDEATRREPYVRLLKRIRGLDRHEPPPGWEHQVDERVRRARERETRRRRVWYGGGLLAAVATLVMVLLWPRGSAPPPLGLAVAVTPPAGPPSRGDAMVGATLNIKLDDPAPQVELRVYRDGLLLLRCPTDVTCLGSPGHLRVDLPLRAPGVYRIVGFTSTRPIPPPDANGLDADALAASKEGASMKWSKSFVVTP
jgi:hypothetical protein